MQALAPPKRRYGERVTGQWHHIRHCPCLRLYHFEWISSLQAVAYAFFAHIVVRNGKSGHEGLDLMNSHIDDDIHVDRQPGLAVQDGREAAYHHVRYVQPFQHLDHVREERLQFVLPYLLHCVHLPRP